MTFSNNFFKNSGLWVLFSSVLSKVFAFLMTIFLVRFLSKDDFGLLTISLNFVGFFLPAVGFGSGHGLLRFGAQKIGKEKETIIQYSHYQGFINQVILTTIIIPVAFLMNLEQVVVFQFTALMAVRLFGMFFLEQAKSELRATFKNDQYSKIEIYTNVLAVILGVVFTYLYGVWGYVVSVCIFPFSVFLMHQFKWQKGGLSKSLKKNFWNFSITSVFTSIIFMWIFLLDVFFVGRYFNSDDVSFYKISTLVPMNLIFIAQVYTQTVYPEICKNHNNKKYLKKFLKTYYTFFVPVCFCIIFFGYLFADKILLLFGQQFTDTRILKIMFLQMASCILFRIPFGNLMGAMGHITASLILGIFMVLGIVISSIILLPNGNIITEAYISLIFITLGGVFALIYFFIKFFKLKNNEFS